MLQEKQLALTKFGAAFLLVYSLLVQKPETGFSLKLNNQNLPVPNTDITLEEIYQKKYISELKVQEKKVVITPEPTPQTKVASITIEKPVEEPKVTPNAVEVIKEYASEKGLDSEIMIKIAECESGLNPSAVNGQYAGIYQFHPQTWESNRKAMNEDPNTSLRFNLEEAVKTAAFKMSRDGFGAWPECSSKAFEQIAKI